MDLKSSDRSKTLRDNVKRRKNQPMDKNPKWKGNTIIENLKNEQMTCFLLYFFMFSKDRFV